MTVLGISSIYKYPKSAVAAIKEAVTLGFRHVNIFAYPPHFKDDSEEFLAKVKKILFDYGIDCSLKIQGYTINIVATNPNLRKKSIDEVKYYIDVAAKLDCPRIILRAGMFFYAERAFKEVTYRRLIKTLREIINQANENGIDVYIENYPYPFDIVVLPSDFYRLYRDIRARVFMALNIPHLYDIYTSRPIGIISDIGTTHSLIKIVYISEYMNPWDYPHRLSPEKYDEYFEMTKKIIKKIGKVELEVVIIIGYNSDDVIKTRDWYIENL